MGLISWIIFGALVGWVASILMHSRRRGLIRNIIIGLIGSVIGGWIATLFNIGSVGSFTFESFLTALAGAIIFIWLLKKL